VNRQPVDVLITRACFDLDEDDGSIAPGNQVDLASGTAKIARENLVAMLLEKPGGDTLPVCAQAKVVARRLPARAPAFYES